MNVHAFRHFTMLAQTLHFGRAAQALAMSQPSLSQSIRRLEASLGTSLFERTRRSVILTDAGRGLLPVARQIVASMDMGKADIARATGGADARLRIGFTEDAAMGALAMLLDRLPDDRPAAGIALLEMPSTVQLDALLVGAIDLAIGDWEGDMPPRLASGVLTQGNLQVAMVRNDPLALQDSLTLAQAAGGTWLIPNDLSPALSARLHGLLPEAGTKAGLTAPGGSSDSCLRLVAAGAGRALVHASWEARKPPEIILRPLADIADGVLVMRCAWLRSSRNALVRGVARSWTIRAASGQ